MNPDKANDYLTLLNAASHYRKGEHIYARTMVDRMADPLDDALQLIGVLMAATANNPGVIRNGGVGYVIRSVDPN